MSDVPPVPTNDPGPPPAPRTAGSTRLTWAAGIVVAVMVAAAVAFGAGRQMGTDGGDATSTTTTTAQPAVTAGPGWSRSDAEIVGAMALALEEASATTALSTATILAVERCSIPLTEASRQLDTVIAQRRATVDAVTALDGSGGIGATAATLVESLEFSLAADEARQRWVEWLSVRWSDTYTTGCWPPGETPTDANLEVAQVATANAAAARTEFLTRFNPFAAAAGLRTWEASEF